MGSGDTNGTRHVQRRVSRTDLDFEQALRAEGTVMLKEGLDVNKMGMDSPSSLLNRSIGSPTPISRNTPRTAQPSTPTVVPPTPTPVAGPSSGKPPAPSPSSSSHDLFYDAEDSERQTNRRSMYRSPGTASSPDLATLLRKAKERGGVAGTHYKKEKRRESPPPVPSPFDRPTSSRQRSSTSHSSVPGSPQVTPLSKTKSKGRGVESSPDWILPSPRLKESGAAKVSTRIPLQDNYIRNNHAAGKELSEIKDQCLSWEDAGAEHSSRTISTVLSMLCYPDYADFHLIIYL